MLDKQHILNRFISYVTIDTQSDPNSETTPSTSKQWDLANALVKELKAIGMQDVTIDENAYIMATLPSNVGHKVPTIGRKGSQFSKVWKKWFLFLCAL